MRSQTYGEVTMQQIAELIYARTSCYPDDKFKLIVGTDSQSYNETRIVTVIALQHIGKGGIFFYNLDIVPRLARVRDKLVKETELSLDYTQKIIDAFEAIKQRNGWDYESILDFSIHVDAGKNGASSEVIPAIVGWVHACGYAVLTKPESWVASCIADRISK